MRTSLETLAFLATIVGTITSILALLQSRLWLVLICVVFICVSAAAGLYARRQRRALNAASTLIEGHSIDSLNIANLRRRVNRTLVIQEALHIARIEGENLEIAWKYSGYCRAEQETAIDFSVDSDDSTSFESLNCAAYDLVSDPEMARPIRPLLIGSEGISRKITVPFLKPLKVHDPFAVLLQCVLPGCQKGEFGYYTSTLSFAHDNLLYSEVRLIFYGSSPKWLRVYDCSRPGKPVLLKTMVPSILSAESCEYRDLEEARPAQSVRLYTFWRNQ